MTESPGGLAWPTGSVEALYDEVRRGAELGTAAGSPPTRAVACVLWRRHEAAAASVEVFLVQRAFSHPFMAGTWGFPEGRIEPGDRDEVAACIRQVRHELAVALSEDRRSFVPGGHFVSPAFAPARFDVQYFLVDSPPGAAPDPAAGDENLAGQWIAPAEALDKFAAGELLMSTPTVQVLTALAAGAEGAGERLRAGEPARRDGRLWALTGGVAICPLRTPTLPPATHTNAYVIGTRELVVVDPASPYEEERALLDRELAPLLDAGARVRAILLTHHHRDHVGGAVHLARRTGAPICAHADTARLLAGEVPVERLLGDGDVVELASHGGAVRRVRALHTPGHAPGHLCFADESTGLIAVGDMLSSVSSILIDPDAEGDMRLYLTSLDLLARAGGRALLPAHGPPVADPPAKLAEYVRHRLWREERVAAALAERRTARARDLVPLAYDDVAPALRRLAERSLLAHLVKLAADGRARRAGEEWTATG